MTTSLPPAPRSLRYFGVFACAAVILYASVLDPGEGTPERLFGIGVTVYLHVVAYAGFAGAVGYALLATDRRALLIAATASMLYGAGIEVVQSFLAYRTMSAFDVAVNAGGATIGAALWWLAAPWFGAER
ncbi:VanZ family protein [Natronomonas gomsonensis]|uniref:VanZ family protein n=1 Tax=Natronomonas gomsonensis TaxID=1046043 RepID=UPI0015B83AD5